MIPNTKQWVQSDNKEKLADATNSWKQIIVWQKSLCWSTDLEKAANLCFIMHIWVPAKKLQRAHL